ncbi:lysine-sensitive aspartokinase 3 [Yersinia rohdei]|nr:lysine-sensitive aspartokinase 3 [Yersinia rohdei]MDN0095790.1 lysine-sensitive aspartokinase 3 [Yersinia rohdei]
MVVAKFGGTSVADFDAMSRSADVVLSNPDVRLVILSASAGVTNLLVALAEGRALEIRTQHVDEIRRIQYSILTKLADSAIIREEIDRMLENITMLSEAASLATSPALTDELVSHGELMSTLLFVELLRQRQIAVEWFDVRKIMRTNDRFGRAEPDTQLLSELAQSQLAPRLPHAIVVTQGFIGSESQGRTTTLGRGGSDYTAALLGEALHVCRIDIWTDVPGIYTTDPRVVPGAKRIDKIAFEEAAEMATFGAKVLHPATLLPAVRCDIPVFVGSSKDPAAGGTLVCNETSNPPLFRALALRRKQTLVSLHSLNMLHARGFLAEVFNILARHNISVDLITTSEVSVALTLDTTGSTSTGDSLLTTSLLTELSSLCRVEVEENLALVAIIGNNLSQACGVGKEVFGVLDPFNIRMICYGASSHNLCFLIPGNDAEKVVQTLHHNLFE